jgi:hypothetical protein
MTTKEKTKPFSAPRGMSGRQAAAYWGVSPGTFKKMVGLGIAPAPMTLPGIDRVIYDRNDIDVAISAQRAVRAGSVDGDGRLMSQGAQKLFDLKEAAKKLYISEEQVRGLVQDGEPVVVMCAIDDTKMTDVMRVLLEREFDRRERQDGVASSARTTKPKHSAGTL